MIRQGFVLGGITQYGSRSFCLFPKIPEHPFGHVHSTLKSSKLNFLKSAVLHTSTREELVNVSKVKPPGHIEPDKCYGTNKDCIENIRLQNEKNYTKLNIIIELELAILPSLFLFSKPIEHFNSPFKKRTRNEIPLFDIDTIPTQIKKPIRFISN